MADDSSDGPTAGAHEVPVLDGVDGRLFVTDAGIRFERGKTSARGRGVAQVVETPWSSVVDAQVTKNLLRVSVAGFQAPKWSISDPWAVTLRRGGQSNAETIAELIRDRGGGASARPVIPTAAPAVEDVEPLVAPTQRPEMDRLLARSLRWGDRLLSCQLVLLGIMLLAGLVMLVVVVLILVG